MPSCPSRRPRRCWTTPTSPSENGAIRDCLQIVVCALSLGKPSALVMYRGCRKFHHALLELQLVEGALVCPETGRKFAVHKGVPNMRLTEDEV